MQTFDKAIYKLVKISEINFHEKPLSRCTIKGDNILDCFGGSGSTLITCEQMSRNAYLIERDPIFCDVIVDRWESLTGKKVKKI